MVELNISNLIGDAENQMTIAENETYSTITTILVEYVKVKNSLTAELFPIMKEFDDIYNSTDDTDVRDFLVDTMKIIDSYNNSIQRARNDFEFGIGKGAIADYEGYFKNLVILYNASTKLAQAVYGAKKISFMPVFGQIDSSVISRQLKSNLTSIGIEILSIINQGLSLITQLSYAKIPAIKNLVDGIFEALSKIYSAIHYAFNPQDKVRADSIQLRVKYLDRIMTYADISLTKLEKAFEDIQRKLESRFAKFEKLIEQKTSYDIQSTQQEKIRVSRVERGVEPFYKDIPEPTTTIIETPTGKAVKTVYERSWNPRKVEVTPIALLTGFMFQ